MKIIRNILGSILILAALLVVVMIVQTLLIKEGTTPMFISLAGSLIGGVLAFFAAFKPKKWMGIFFMLISPVALFMPNFEYQPMLYIAITAFVFFFGLSVVLSLKKREVIG